MRLHSLLLLAIALVGLGSCKKKELCVRFSDRASDCYKELKYKNFPKRKHTLKLCRILQKGQMEKAYGKCLKKNSCKAFFSCVVNVSDRMEVEARKQKSKRLSKPNGRPRIANRPKYKSLLKKVFDKGYRELLRGAQAELDEATKLELSTLYNAASLRKEIEKAIQSMTVAWNHFRYRQFPKGISVLNSDMYSFAFAVRAAQALLNRAQKKEKAEAAKAGGKAGGITRSLNRRLSALTRLMMELDDRHLQAYLAMCHYTNRDTLEVFVDSLLQELQLATERQKKGAWKTLRACYKIERNPKRKAAFGDKLTKAKIPHD